jgi:hypothetical protein
MSSDDETFPTDRIWRIQDIRYMMGLGQGSRAAPSSWIQLSAVLVNVFKQLNLGSMITDPVTAKTIHTMRACFVDDIDLYTWREDIVDPGGVWNQAQVELEHWSCLLNATGGGTKARKMLLVPSRLQMCGRQMEVRRDDSP